MNLAHPLIVKTLVWQDEAATESFAKNLAQRPALCQALIALSGDLGAGKTSFVRHLLRALGAQGRVKSPSYAIVEPYELPGLNVWHFDLYRMSDPREFEEAGFRDLLAAPGLKLVEWPDKARGALPALDLELKIEALADDSRAVQALAYTALGQELLA